MKKNFSPESRAFMQIDYANASPIGRLLRNIPEEQKTEALLHFYRLRYSEYDLDRPFLEQFQRNQEKLLAILSRIAKKNIWHQQHGTGQSSGAVSYYGGIAHDKRRKEHCRDHRELTYWAADVAKSIQMQTALASLDRGSFQLWSDRSRVLMAE